MRPAQAPPPQPFRRRGIFSFIPANRRGCAIQIIDIGLIMIVLLVLKSTMGDRPVTDVTLGGIQYHQKAVRISDEGYAFSLRMSNTTGMMLPLAWGSDTEAVMVILEGPRTEVREWLPLELPAALAEDDAVTLFTWTWDRRTLDGTYAGSGTYTFTTILGLPSQPRITTELRIK